jgi:hypothetical protein
LPRLKPQFGKDGIMLGKIGKSKIELVLDGEIVDSRVIDLPAGETEVGRHVRDIAKNLMVASLRISLSYVIKGDYRQGLDALESLMNGDGGTKEG